MEYYAKSEPKETIMEHTNKLLENLKILKNVYNADITQNKEFDEDRFWYLLEIICKYHDIGKVYTPFQDRLLGRITSNTKFSYEKVRHEQLSPMFVPVEKLGLTEKEKILVYQSIYYHHEKENKEISKEYIRQVIEEDIKPQLESIKNNLSIEIREQLDTRYIKYVQDRITEYNSKNNELYPEYCMLKGLLHRLDHSSSAGIEVEKENGQVIEKNTTDFMKKNKFSRNELQEYTVNNQDKNIVVIGSTGMGKTEAALFWSKNSKTFFTLPIRVSINAIFDRINENMKYKNVGLLHGAALDYLKEKKENEEVEEAYEQAKNLSFKITTCTID